MSRLAPADYLKTHRWLAELWAERTPFSLLSPRDQHYLHDYFLPSQAGLMDEELLAHREQATAARPSLPHCAGRALLKLQAEVQTMRVSVSYGRVSKRRIVVTAVAKALLRAARDLTKQDQDEAA